METLKIFYGETGNAFGFVLFTTGNLGLLFILLFELIYHLYILQSFEKYAFFMYFRGDSDPKWVHLIRVTDCYFHWFDLCFSLLNVG